MSYCELLRLSAQLSGNCACMGLDPILEFLPHQSTDVRQTISTYFNELLTAMAKSNLTPAAFKPNLGFFSTLDRPYEGSFSGSLALADLLTLLRKTFPNIPVILDSKRGDIARSSLNYANEAFEVWQADAVTVSPYMGSDSIQPFLESGRGCYILNRTSNRGASDFQDLPVGSSTLYQQVAQFIATLGNEHENIGAVVGAVNREELAKIASYYAPYQVPLLIPGVGSQGASARETLAIVREAGYEISLARINSSSALTHPWKSQQVPSDYLEQALENIRELLEECSL